MLYYIKTYEFNHVRGVQKVRFLYRIFAISPNKKVDQRPSGQDSFQKPHLAYRRVIPQVIPQDRKKDRSQAQVNNLHYILNTYIISLARGEYGKR